MLAIICLLGKPQSPMNRPLRWSGCAAFCRFLALPGNEKNKNPAFGTCENRLFDAYPLRGFFMGTSIAILKNKKFVFGRVQKLRSRCLSPERIFFSNSCWTFCKNTMSADYAKQRNWKSLLMMAMKTVHSSATPWEDFFFSATAPLPKRAIHISHSYIPNRRCAQAERRNRVTQPSNVLFLSALWYSLPGTVKGKCLLKEFETMRQSGITGQAEISCGKGVRICE